MVLVGSSSLAILNYLTVFLQLTAINGYKQTSGNILEKDIVTLQTICFNLKYP